VEEWMEAGCGIFQGVEFKLLARSEGSLIDDESRYDKKLNIPAQWYQE